MSRLILFNKPFNVLSQFTDGAVEKASRGTLADYVSEPDVYPAGRLDRDSEGLLLLTDNGKLQARIANPKYKLPKTYWVQVEGLADEAALDALRAGVDLKDGPARAAHVARIEEPLGLWERTPAVRFRKTVPDCWLSLTITEGRNRQVRRMTAAAGHPTLRLIRASIGEWALEGLPSGAWREVLV